MSEIFTEEQIKKIEEMMDCMEKEEFNKFLNILQFFDDIPKDISSDFTFSLNPNFSLNLYGKF